jgi:hypothetical protein
MGITNTACPKLLFSALFFQDTWPQQQQENGTGASLVAPSQKEAPGGWRHPRKSKSSDEELHVLFIQQRALDLRWSLKNKKLS